MSRNRKNRTIKPSKQAILDVCIVETGRYDLLSTCLDALYREAQLVPLNILILDNGTEPKERLDNQHLLTYQKDKDPQGNVINFSVKRSPQNLGFPAGSNEAARMGHAPLILFISDDIELLPGAIEKVVQTFDDPTIGIVGIKLMFPLSSTHPNRPAGKVQHVGLGMNIRGEIIHPLVGWSPTHPKTCLSRDVWAVTGGAFFIRRNLFSKFKGWDTIYGLGTHEDTDLCMKVRQAGSRIYLNAEAQGYHYVGATAEKLQVNFPLQQNRNIFMSRWQNSGLIFWNEVDWW